MTFTRPVAPGPDRPTAVTPLLPFPPGLVDGIAARLEWVRAGMAPAEFAALVASVARFTQRWGTGERAARET